MPTSRRSRCGAGCVRPTSTTWVRDGLSSAEQSELVQLPAGTPGWEMENEILRRAAAYFAKDALSKMMLPLARALAADKFPVRLICGVLGFSAQAYYKWLAEPVTHRNWQDAHTINALVDAHRDDPEFGYRVLTDELAAAGHSAGERRVWRLCSQQQLWSTATSKGHRGRAGPQARQCTTTSSNGVLRPRTRTCCG